MKIAALVLNLAGLYFGFTGALLILMVQEKTRGVLGGQWEIEHLRQLQPFPRWYGLGVPLLALGFFLQLCSALLQSCYH
jgi:hypothetical protein